MERLPKLLARLARRSGARHWAGSRPEGRVGQLPRLIAAQIGYPTTSHGDPFAEKNGLSLIGRREAAETLAYAATVSLAHNFGRTAAKGMVKLVHEAFEELQPTAVFLTSGTSFSDATFESGVMGYDDRSAFIFWVEEED
jgi:hypothetical protein